VHDSHLADVVYYFCDARRRIADGAHAVQWRASTCLADAPQHDGRRGVPSKWWSRWSKWSSLSLVLDQPERGWAFFPATQRRAGRRNRNLSEAGGARGEARPAVDEILGEARPAVDEILGGAQNLYLTQRRLPRAPRYFRRPQLDPNFDFVRQSHQLGQLPH